MNTVPPKVSSAVIAGLGKTGLSCARFLLAHGWSIAVTDTTIAEVSQPRQCR